MNIKRLLSSLVLGLIVIATTACGGSDGGHAFVRVIHGSPDAPEVDVLVDDAIVLSSVPYLTGSSHLAVDDGTRNFKVNAAGTTTTVIDANVPLSKDVYYTVLASNFLASITPVVLVDTVKANSGTSLVRVVHNSPSAPKVDVYVTAVGAGLTTSTPALTNIGFGAVSDYIGLTPGEYQVRVTLAGTSTVVIDSGAIMVGDGATYTAIAMDNTGGGAPFGLSLYRDSL